MTVCLSLLALLWIALPSLPLAAQSPPPTARPAANPTTTADDVAAEVVPGSAADDSSVAIDVAERVQVDPTSSDNEIENRLQEILEATQWFVSPQVTVDRGVAFLAGTSDTQKHQQWAEATAMKTSDVVAVINRIQVAEKPLWNFAPAIASLKQLGREATGILPLVVVALLIGLLSYYVAIGGARLTRWLTRSRLDSTLLRQVAGNVVGVLMFVIGIYIALRVSGLTRLAVTLLGGTGLIGLALGFAFRDIAENYLASILISLNHPFRVGDLIEVEGAKGFVRKVTTRGTVLNTLQGNQIQLPNSTVYKGKITNFTATPLSRLDFTVGIGFDDSVTEAQQLIMQVLGEHVAVVDDPEPMVIVESLGAATVNLCVYYWFDQTKFSPLKVSSSIIRQVKQVLTEAQITMPDEARELVFPHGVPVQLLESTTTTQAIESPPSSTAPEKTVNVGEGDLGTEQSDVIRATANDQTIDDEANLIS
ncbi:mechanosensitive ion channel [Stieleria sp. TO1_6]|uniref:mechanosensitive ion channel domain-containing protein n=1 Tax=Stieleria tagensis TaxID=2956795 RepID=UPI00209A7BEC|nr:mechanosensitive ion channel domain-containing protein [Stieleria tagensis]MCO8122038.1 mechanosensitive ion channel [Stieleria tagensis]